MKFLIDYKNKMNGLFKADTKDHGKKLCITNKSNFGSEKGLYIHKGKIYQSYKYGPESNIVLDYSTEIVDLTAIVGLCKFMQNEGIKDKGCSLILGMHEQFSDKKK